MKPIDTGKKMEGEALKHGCRCYFAGERKTMKRAVARKRRREDKKGLDHD